MASFKEYLCRALYHVRRMLGDSDGSSIIIFFGLLSMSVGVSFLFASPLASAILQFLNIFSFFVIVGIFASTQLKNYLWKFFVSHLLKAGVREIFYLDRDELMKDWIFNHKFLVIKDPPSLFNLAAKHYQGDRLRTNSDFFLDLVAQVSLTPDIRGFLVEKYYSYWATPSYNFEHHRVEVFKKILDIPHDFNFPGGCEKFYILFENSYMREKMAQRGWKFAFMESFIGPDFFLYNAPSPYLLKWRGDFDSFYLTTIGKQPKLKKWMQENLINRETKQVKWKYFQFLQLNYFFNLNYDVLLQEMQNCFIKKQDSPFLAAHVFQEFNERDKIKESILYLKKHYPDQRLLKVLKTVADRERFLKLHDLIQRCLEKKHLPYMPKKVKTWQELLELTEEDVRKIEQGDFFLNQWQIYHWDRSTILDYEIFVPRSNFRLIHEGTKLRNCVGNGDYVKGIVGGNTLIFFLLKDKKVQVCIDLKKNEMELRTIKFKHNQDVPPLLKEAVESFIRAKALEDK